MISRGSRKLWIRICNSKGRRWSSVFVSRCLPRASNPATCPRAEHFPQCATRLERDLITKGRPVCSNVTARLGNIVTFPSRRLKDCDVSSESISHVENKSIHHRLTWSYALVFCSNTMLQLGSLATLGVWITMTFSRRHCSRNVQ